VRELFVWYRVRDERADEARAAVRAMQRSLAAAWPGLQARLLTRVGDVGVQTWMETYSRAAALADDDDGVGSIVEAAIEAAARSLADMIDGARHAEAFTTSGSA
jgi:Domain of unknown function (DUF4936)